MILVLAILVKLVFGKGIGKILLTNFTAVLFEYHYKFVVRISMQDYYISLQRKAPPV